MTARDIAALFDALELDLVKSLHRCLAHHQQQEQAEAAKTVRPGTGRPGRPPSCGISGASAGKTLPSWVNTGTALMLIPAPC